MTIQHFSKSRCANETFRMTRVIISSSPDFWLTLVYHEMIDPAVRVSGLNALTYSDSDLREFLQLREHC